MPDRPPDRYQAWTGTAPGRFLVSRLGLPNPRPLRRYVAGDAILDSAYTVGGIGKAAAHARDAIEAAGGEIADVGDEVELGGAVLDATELEGAAGLAALTDFFTPLVKRLSANGRVIVLGTTPELTASPAARIAQRALEGFTRSFAKEIRRGGTVQLVYLDPSHQDQLASTLQFLLSAKSAYVSGQVVRIGNPVSAAPGVDLDRPLAGKVALVTGASRGIGAAIAETLHRDGATVIGVDVPAAASDLEQLARSIDGDRVVLDITAVDAPPRLARAIEDKHGGVDIVVHNAGITRDKLLVNMTRDRWDPVLSVNLAAPIRITEAFLEHGLIRPNGRVVAVASMAAIAGNAGQTNYATSKAGVIGFVDAFSDLTRDASITVNAVAPGFIETQMTAAMPILLREAGRRMNAMRQGGLPVDVAETIAWLANPASAGVTGNTIRVCGQSLLGA